MDLKLELISFAKNYEVLQLTFPVSVDSGCEALCKKCAVCVLAIIGANRLNEKANDNLYQAYKFSRTLSVTQVQCERGFSKLKIIKIRVRGSLPNDLFEACMVLSIEEKWVDKVNKDEIIINRLLSF